MHSTPYYKARKCLTELNIEKQFKIDIHECRSLCECDNSFSDELIQIKKTPKDARIMHNKAVEIKIDNAQVGYNYCCTSENSKLCRIF
jgi:hypothetical protein